MEMSIAERHLKGGEEAFRSSTCASHTVEAPHTPPKRHDVKVIATSTVFVSGVRRVDSRGKDMQTASNTLIDF
jgi:hypothetical protein